MRLPIVSVVLLAAATGLGCGSAQKVGSGSGGTGGVSSGDAGSGGGFAGTTGTAGRGGSGGASAGTTGTAGRGGSGGASAGTGGASAGTTGMGGSSETLGTGGTADGGTDVPVVIPDTTAPTVASTSPANNATNVAVNATLSVTFSEAMNPGTVDLTITPSATLGDVMFDDNNKVASVTTSALTPATMYTITIVGSDLAGNALAGTKTFTFTTAQPPDTVRPTVVSTVPASGSTGVAFQTVIAVSFSEAMNQAMTAGAITIAPAVSCLGGGWTWNAAGTFASCQPATALPAATAYTVTVGVGARDVAGNQLQAAFPFTFTTANAPDTTPPTIVSVTPASGSVGAPVSTTIAVTFSEPMNLASAQTAFQVTSPTGVTGTFTWSGGGTVLTFDPAANFTNGQTVIFQVNMAAQDAAGNAKAATNSYSFRIIRRGMVVLTSNGAADGFIESTPTVQTTGINLRAGDSATNTFYQSYISFDLALPGVTTDAEAAQTTIVAASLEVTQYFPTTGFEDTYTMLGALRFEHISYGPTLETSDMSTTVFRTYSTTNNALGAKTLSVITAVRDDWTSRVARGKRTQFRLRFTTNTSTNSMADYVSFYSGDYTTAAGQPHLTVQYDYP